MVVDAVSCLRSKPGALKTILQVLDAGCGRGYTSLELAMIYCVGLGDCKRPPTLAMYGQGDVKSEQFDIRLYLIGVSQEMFAGRRGL